MNTTKRGLFLAPTMDSLGYGSTVFLRNTLRNPNDPLQVQKKRGIKFHSIFLDSNGQEITPRVFGSIPFNSFFKLNEAAPGVELIATITEIEDNSPQWFEQEHEVFYHSNATSANPSVIYDQLPYREVQTYAPIILLNHKAYVSNLLNSIVVISNYRGKPDMTITAQPMEFTILDESGIRLKTIRRELTQNTVHYFDIRKELAGNFNLGDEAQLVNVTARGGNSMFAIQTAIINEHTRNMALEHSLAPPYFISSGLSEVRSKALRFAGNNK